MQCFCNSWCVRNLLVMVLRLNKSLKYRELIPTEDCSGPAPTFVPFNSEYSIHRLSLTMQETTPFRRPEYSCWQKFTSHSWRLKYIILHHLEHLQVAHQKNLIVCSAPQRFEPSQCCEFTTMWHSLEDLGALSYLEHLENIADSESQPSPPPLPWTESYPTAGALLSDYIAEPLDRHPQGFLEMILQNNTYYLFTTHEEYKYIQCGIKKKCMKMYYDNVLRVEYTSLRFPSSSNGDGVQQLRGSMPDDLALGEWERHTLHDMKWNENHQCSIKYWSQDINNSMRWLMRQPVYAEHLIYAPQRCFISDTSLKRLYTDMYTADWWWETQVRAIPGYDDVLSDIKSTLRVGDTLVPLIIMSDRTHLSNFSSDKKEWPVYMTIGNLSPKLRLMPWGDSVIMVALLPFPNKNSNIRQKPPNELGQSKREVLNEALRWVLHLLTFK